MVLISIGTGFYFLYPREYSELLDPVVELGKNTNAAVAGDSIEVDSSLPVSCVLSYGTFFVDQNSCDELNAFDEGEKSGESVTCEVKDGTFLVSEKECQILKNSKGSRDIMRRID